MPTTSARPSTPSHHIPTLVDARELARILGVPVSFVHRKSSEGRIPRRKLGHRTVRYDPEEVLAALQSTDAGTAPSSAPRRQSPPPAAAASKPVNDLPSYDWSPSPRANGTLPSADRRG